MNIFFKKKLTESDLRELLLSGNESKWNQLRKYFIQQLRLQDLKSSPKKYFFNNLKVPHESKTSFEKAFQNLIKNPPLPDQSILNSFERHLDFELIQLMQANDLTLLNQAENYLFFRFSEIPHFLEFKKLVPDEEKRLDAFADALVHFFQRIQLYGFEQRSTLKTFFNVLFKNECIDDYRKKENPTHQVWNGEDEELLLQLNSFEQLKNTFSKYDIEELRFILKQFEKDNPDCHQQIDAYYLKEIPTTVLAEVADKTTSKIRGARFRCMAKFRAFWEKMKKSEI